MKFELHIITKGRKLNFTNFYKDQKEIQCAIITNKSFM